MPDQRLQPIQDIVKKAQAIHEELIAEFTKGGIFDPLQAPLLKKGIKKFEDFFIEIGNTKSVDEMEKVIKKHFTLDFLIMVFGQTRIALQNTLVIMSTLMTRE